MNRLVRLSLVMAFCMLQAIAPVNASGFILNVFGNANLDETIDENDVVYVDGVIKGANVATNLSDANYDGKIDTQDIDQIKSIISGTEKELTFIDVFGKNSTVHLPIGKIVAVHSSTVEALRILNKYKDIVGIDEWTYSNYPTLRSTIDAQSVGAYADFDMETILKLKPDVVICSRSHNPNIEKKLNGTGIDVVRLSFSTPDPNLSALRILSYIINKKDEASAYENWHDNILKSILEKTSALSDDEKPNALWIRFAGDSGKVTTCGSITPQSKNLELAGGRNIAANLKGEYPELDIEWALEQNPDVIMGFSFSGGYDTKNSDVLKEYYEQMVNMSGFDKLSAVKNGKIFVIYSALGDPCDKAYISKCLHPDLFTSMDPAAIQQEYVSKFLHLDFDVKTQGAFVYPQI